MKLLAIILTILLGSIPLEVWQTMSEKSKQEMMSGFAHKYYSDNPECKNVNIEAQLQFREIFFLGDCNGRKIAI